MKKGIFSLLFTLLVMQQACTHDTILIIDYGSPITHRIAPCLQEVQVHSCTCWYTQAEEIIKLIQPKGIILSGSPLSVLDADSPRAPETVFSGELPILGICYGQQVMCVQLGGTAKVSECPEYGKTDLHLTNTCALTQAMWSTAESPITIWMGHRDIIATVPPGFVSIGHTEHSPYAFIADDSRKLYGVQFHPEAAQVPDNHTLIHAFALDIVKAQPDPMMLPPKITTSVEFEDEINGCC